MATEKHDNGEEPDGSSTIERAEEDARSARRAAASSDAARTRAEEAERSARKAQARAEQNASALREDAAFRELFIGIVGHDLRNPLAAIKMAAGLLLARGHLDEPDTTAVTRILGSTQRMSKMIGQLLDFTQARLGGGLPIEPKPTDLRLICQSIIAEFEPGAVELNLQGDLSGTWDDDRLAQLLSNLVGNAIEYAAFETTVAVRAYSDDSDVVVEITNQGEAIPPDVLPFIFDPFRRGRRRESLSGNLGLGLYIANEIVIGHRGTLAARSGDGTTTFTIRLPRRMPPSPAR